MTAIEDSLRWARVHAVRHMAACEEAGLRWGETSITEVVTSRAAKAVCVVPFTQPAEGKSGADWVWWWVDGRGAYGMLVQAKRLNVKGGRWGFDFDYPRGTGAQRSALMSTARALGLLPVYALYLGSGDYRNWDPCPDGHRYGRCLHCVKRSVSLMPALLANELFVDNAATVYEQSVALEELLARPTRAAMLIPQLRRQLNPELLDFLVSEQRGTRAVTRAMLDRILRVRAGSFQASPTVTSKPVNDQPLDRLGLVFPELPSDAGHFGLNYFHHTLDPLHHAPPSYVVAAMSGEIGEAQLQPEFPDNVAGVVVVPLRRDV